MKFLITFMCDGKFVADFMHMWQIADLYGMNDCNGTSDWRVYRLTPDAEPERLYIREDHRTIALFTETGEQVTEYEDWPVH